MTILTNQEFGQLFESFRETAFRLESLDLYWVPEEAVEYSRFLAGEQLPSVGESEWGQFIKKSVGQKKTINRVHVVSMPLTPYLKFEIEWGYPSGSLAGENIRLLDRAAVPPGIPIDKDFWLFDKETMVVMRYDSAGHFLHGEREDSPSIVAAHCEIATALLSRAVPLKAFLAQLRNA